MLPETLMMQAFGPYVERQEIDFTRFPHLFLIRGETGSGKTMILDAITYALYGKSSGGQREDFESMRSRFADDKTITLVDFTFRLKGHRYRFFRKVEVREKRNKEKTVKVTLDAGEIKDGIFCPFFENPKLKNIEDKAVSLIGLTHEQFIQVMILPQGKFEQLLTSKSEEKQEILRTLFQMEKWDSISIYLSEKANEMRKDMEERRQRVDVLMESVHASNQEEIQNRCSELDQQKEQKQKELHKLEAGLKQIQEDINQQRLMQKQQEEQTALLQKEASLMEQKESYHQRERIITAYEEVEKLLPYYQSMLQYQAAFQKRKQEYEDAVAKEVLAQKNAEHLDQLKQELETLQLRIPQLTKKETVLIACMEALQQLNQQQHLIKESTLSKEEIQTKLMQQQERTAHLQQQHDLLYEAYLNDTAMQLREVLKDHEPCPVCGSLHHPYTTTTEKQYVDVMKLKSIKEQCTQAKEEMQQLEIELAKATAELTQLQQQAKTLQQEYKDRYHEFGSYGSMEELKAYHHQLQVIIEQQTMQEQQQEQRIQDIVTEVKECQIQTETKKQEYQLAEDNRKQAVAAFEQQNQQGYEEQRLQHQPDAAIITRYRSEQKDYQLSCAQVHNRLEELKLSLETVQPKNLENLFHQQEEKEQQRKTLLRETAELDSSKKQLHQVLTKSEAMRSEYEALQPSYQKLIHFSKAMRGDNSVGIERYVLGIMLSNITQNANKLLQGVHNGRYQIYRSERASGKTRKFGLEFSIYDAYTCSMRSVVSLSGGEKFLVSLALSLALSISVQARNGGISFDCMFIDEGFGTLDEHSIADALTILEKMSHQKGTIGIISHVEVLKENIPDGIEVEKTRNGSTISIRRD